MDTNRRSFLSGLLTLSAISIVKLKSFFINVKDYGAIPIEESALPIDNTAAFRAAMDAVQQGGTLYIPAGTYHIGGLFDLNLGKRMVGDGVNKTTVHINNRINIR